MLQCIEMCDVVICVDFEVDTGVTKDDTEHPELSCCSECEKKHVNLIKYYFP